MTLPAPVEAAPWYLTDVREAAAQECNRIGAPLAYITASRGRTPRLVRARNTVAAALRARGFSYGDIAKVVGWADHTSARHAVLHGRKLDTAFAVDPVLPAVRERSPRITAARAELAAAFREIGMSWPEVALLAGYSSHSSAMEAAARVDCDGNLPGRTCR